jgi:hypothetical protein
VGDRDAETAMGEGGEDLSELQSEGPGDEVGEMRRRSRARIEVASSTSIAVYWVASYNCWWNLALSLRLLRTTKYILGNRPAVGVIAN